MIEETINVKLRYEEIIKNIISNEEDGRQQSVLEVIEFTKAKTKVSVKKPKMP